MKIVHCADIHLDSPMETHMSREQANRRNTELLKTFLRMIAYAVENEVRVVLIAGDWFDQERATMRTVSLVLDAIRKTPQIEYLYLCGNHDAATYAFEAQDIPENLKQFSDKWKTYRYDNVAISGVEINDENKDSIYREVPHVYGCFNIVTLHGQVGKSSGVDQVNLTQLRGKGIDYLALGHIHTHAKETFDRQTMYCYPGCMEGRGFDECGEKGFVLLDIQKNKTDVTFIPFALRRLHRISVDITGLETNSEIFHAMKEAAGEIASKDMVEFLLCGQSSPSAQISTDYLQQLICDEFFFVKVKDESRLGVNQDDYKNDISLKGEFVRLVLASDRSEEEKKQIIQMGLRALSGQRG